MTEHQLIYSIGDVHGHDDLLAQLMNRITAHAAGRPHQLILLGDYIDRGPASAQVITRLITLQTERPAGDVICLRGNHEQLCLDALAAGGGWQVNHWRQNGGDATLASYAPPGEVHSLQYIPPNHRAWIAALPVLHQDARRVYVHAGVEPDTPLEQQDAETFLWIREKFLRAPPGSFPAHVVHGHTPTWANKRDWAEPELLPHRTNLDTGAYSTGVLTAGVFTDTDAAGPSDILRAQQRI